MHGSASRISGSTLDRQYDLDPRALQLTDRAAQIRHQESRHPDAPGAGGTGYPSRRSRPSRRRRPSARRSRRPRSANRDRVRRGKNPTVAVSSVVRVPTQASECSHRSSPCVDVRTALATSVSMSHELLAGPVYSPCASQLAAVCDSSPQLSRRGRSRPPATSVETTRSSIASDASRFREDMDVLDA